MDKYQPERIERSWYGRWEDQNYFAPTGNGQPFCIMIPPPNVTGSLHMGHAFQHSLVDAIIRYHRMRGDRTLWQMGTDHAGIATQLVVEEQLTTEGTSGSELGREKFVERTWQWREESGGTITTQIRRLGASLHWETERFTMDEGLSSAVLEVFVRLYDEGLIYRGERLVNWDPELQTSISDLEVTSEDEAGHLWHLRYPLVEPTPERPHLVVATTRPETMLGDTAVAVHPSDERYADLVGKTVQLPLTGREIPIIADHHVDPEFGSGCVKITPAHDFNDNEIGQRHGLEVINVLTPTAKINDNAPEKYHGLDRFEARDAVLADLEAEHLLADVEDHTLAVPRGEKSGAVIEPYLSDQWFVKIEPLATPAIKAVEDGDIRFVPKGYENNYFAWMREIQDWCISRQLWWGHRIPAWYDEQGNIYVGRHEAEAREKHGLGPDVVLRQDEDVLDTWFSSALWTFSTLGWPEQTEDLATFHSTDLMVTAHDIITFWVSRMIMMTLHFMGEVPFREVYIHGLITDANGQKMSKSKGNGLDPLDIIDGITLDDLVAKRTANLMQSRLAPAIAKATRQEYPEGIPAFGTDALRFTFASLATRSRAIRFDLKRVEGNRNFCNKLWNAAEFVLLNCADEDCGAEGGERELSLADRWIVSRLQIAIEDVVAGVESYRFDLATKAIYEFTWDEFCSWYLEMTKPVLYADTSSEAQLRGTRYTLVRTLETLLRLAHPLIPFITEELWQQISPLAGETGDTIMLQFYPTPDAEKKDDGAIAGMEWFKEVVSGVRNIRGEMNISHGKPIPVLFHNGSEEDRRRLQLFDSLLNFLIKPERLEWLAADASVPVAATHLAGDMRILVPMAGLIDKDAELARLDKEIQRKLTDRSRAEGKLQNPKFVENAPRAVVQKEQDKVTDLSSALETLSLQRERVASL